MGDYISRSVVLDKAAKVPLRERNYRTYDNVVRAIPAADVVEVVRCSECRYAYDTVCGWCCSHGICVDCTVREDFFCADGERKDGGQDE